MNSNKPYLIRAYYDWIIDNELTPYLVVDADFPNTVVPEEYIEDGKIILNVGPDAIRGLSIGNEEIEFWARFSGEKFNVSVFPDAVLAIYAQENGVGIVFNQISADDEDGDDIIEVDLGEQFPVEPVLKVIDTPAGEPEAKNSKKKTTKTETKSKQKSKAKGRPTLKIVK